jgi:hypothetical protein
VDVPLGTQRFRSDIVPLDGQALLAAEVDGTFHRLLVTE